MVGRIALSLFVIEVLISSCTAMSGRCNRCVCAQPKLVGPCEALIPRYFYNTDTGECEKFNYGGCKGNENNFETLKDCQAKCLPENQSGKCTRCACAQPADVGPCDGVFLRYYYSTNTDRCQVFNWGGCGGNANRFDDSIECAKNCL